MKHQLRSAVCTEGRKMAGARALWVATGMKQEQFGKPIIAIVNSFTQFVPGHTHLHEIGQIVKKEIESMGCYAAEFNTIAIDDGIAMGHDGMLYSLPSRDIIADSVEYMVNAHKADAMICISNCDKITPGMLMATMRLNIPTVFCSGGPMEAGKWKGENADLITAMIKGADTSVSDEDMQKIEGCACPGCGCCSGMFTANSMNSLTEAIGMALPGNGTILATHKNRIRLFKDAARQIVTNAMKYYEEGDESVLPRSTIKHEPQTLGELFRDLECELETLALSMQLFIQILTKISEIQNVVKDNKDLLQIIAVISAFTQKELGFMCES